ncbi:MAG: hypothetical protein Faunusvirus36_7 [Faunusvirus sp.]|jgi:hypothetical protein|uniref:Uncharacterized protein n=1 Tax=Faunusvirus sp. TaxID=2487766 RepID=A0A3G4ZXU9_9VIRU|nr:MAG: hypothetical protein Faunusvirus36_7 [Faunusvirus sp.]
MSEQTLPNKFSVDEFGNIQMNGKVVVPIDYATITPNPDKLADIVAETDNNAREPEKEQVKEPVKEPIKEGNKTKRRKRYKPSKSKLVTTKPVSDERC